ncbi:Glycoside hydrolase, superfamily [Ophiocordyceps sinensis CO18]|nr:Glycoside hydrolase, superfamily [Ophiocordyceps sinensis CO18]
MGRGQNPVAGDSHSTLNPFGTPAATHSPSRSINSFGRPSSLPDDPYQSYSSNPRHGVDVGLVDPHDIEDDGDDGLNYSRRPQRASLFNRPNSDRNAKSGPKATAVGVGVGVGAGTGAAARGLMSNNGPDEAIRAFDGGAGQEKPSAWLSQQKGRSKTCKWVTIVLVFLVIVGAIAGGVIGSFVAGNKKGTGNSSATSASDDAKLNGDLNLDSKDIKALMNDPNLHRVFPGMDYTPLKTQYPDCMSDPPSQNNVTRDVAVLSQLTNKIRLYGTDCNQTEMVLHAVKQLKLEKDVKIWLGVWQDMNETTNSRQLEQMWTILDQYGAEPFEGLIIANEILFRKEMSISSLATVLGDVRKKLASKNINLPVATSDLGDDWTSELAKDSDYIMANIHPFFAGVSAETAASWTWTFWEGKDGPLWKSDKNKNIIAETGWPSAGGKNCGQAQTTSCEPGSVAGIKEMNRFMEDWVCQALTNGTQYFWFEAFDEPWKIRFNEKDKNWEDKWGLMDIDRKLKDGVKIPDCGGKTV